MSVSVQFHMGWGPHTDYGACVQQMDIWQDVVDGIGRWEVIVDPAGNCSWPAVNTITLDRGAVVTGARVTLEIDTGAGPVVMMRGYIDDVLPYLDKKGYHTRLYKLVGRSRAMDLAQHQVSARYIATRGDLLITNALGLTPAPATELTLAVIGAVPGNVLDYEADRVYLSDLVREIANLSTNAAGTNNYEFYVNNTIWPANATLNFFLHGASASGLTLQSFPNSLTNNILGIDPCGEVVGFNIKNDILVHSGSLQDHYTDLNAADYTSVNSVVSDQLGLFTNGKGSIRARNETGGAALIDLTLSFAGTKYGYATLDLSEPTIGSYNYLIHETGALATPRVRFYLTDNAASQIVFTRAIFPGIAKCKNCTELAPADMNQFRTVDFPLGDEAAIEGGAGPPLTTKGCWWYQNVGAGFDWSNVQVLYWETTGQAWQDDDYFIIDGLTFPNHEPISIQQDGPGVGTSITRYGRRMKDFFRPDIKNQYELDAFAAQQLARLKDPKETIRVTAIGQAGTPPLTTPFAGQTIDVIATAFGIGGPFITDTIVYRILRLHHRVVKNSDDSDFPGYTFTTEFDLVRHEYRVSGDTQLVDHTRVINITDPSQSMERRTRLEERYRRREGNVRLIP